MKFLIVPAAALAISACSGEPSAERTTAPDATVAADSGTAGAPQVALGLTERQLLDADLVDSAGNELGDVEGLVRAADGTVDRLLVEIEDTTPDRFVHVPVNGLTAFDDGDDKDLRTTMTRAQLMALPEVRSR